MKTVKKTLGKTNTYIKLGLIMLAFTIVGGILGFLSFFILDGKIDSIELGMSVFLTQLQRFMLPLLLIITVLSIVLEEWNIKKLKTNCRKLLQSSDEECDIWDYEEERIGAWGMLINILSQILCILVLSVGYSIQYITDNHHQNMLISCVIFLMCFIYDGIWQARFVKTVQTAHPEKKGDPSSRKFQQQWLESCDEAEREVIYQSSYKTYSQISRWIPILLVITMLGHLFFNTGIMAIAVVALIWLIVTTSYLHSCVNLKGAKLRE